MTKKSEKQLAVPGEKSEPVEPEIIEPNEIITAAYRSLDAQVAALDDIPINAETKCSTLLDAVFSEENLFEGDGKRKFVIALLSTSEEVGHAFHTVLEIEREQASPQAPAPQMQMPQLSMGPISGGGTVERNPSPNLVVQTQTQPLKIGYFAMRRWTGTLEKFLEAQKQLAQAQITSAKVIPNILDYGKQLEAEWMALLEFYDGARAWLHFYNDKETYNNLHQEVETHITKMVSIIRAFARTIVEYRKERFGDRKVGVASGVIALQIAQTQALGGMSMSDLYRSIREASGPENAGR